MDLPGSLSVGAIPSCEVYACFNSVRFLGKYGSARVHADAIACGHIGTATRRELMMYVRKVLRRSDVKHGLSAAANNQAATALVGTYAVWGIIMVIFIGLGS